MIRGTERCWWKSSTSWRRDRQADGTEGGTDQHPLLADGESNPHTRFASLDLVLFGQSTAAGEFPTPPSPNRTNLHTTPLARALVPSCAAPDANLWPSLARPVHSSGFNIGEALRIVKALIVCVAAIKGVYVWRPTKCQREVNKLWFIFSGSRISLTISNKYKHVLLCLEERVKEFFLSPSEIIQRCYLYFSTSWPDAVNEHFIFLLKSDSCPVCG